jgi:hypothetical protein
MVSGCNAGDLPFDAEFPEKPLPAVDQKTRKGPADVSKSDEREINLSRFLFHSSSISLVWVHG